MSQALHCRIIRKVSDDYIYIYYSRTMVYPERNIYKYVNAKCANLRRRTSTPLNASMSFHAK